MSEPCMLDADDVKVVPIVRTACDDCGADATHFVVLDMRNNGCGHAVAELCEEHANEFAQRLRESLPKSAP